MIALALTSCKEQKTTRDCLYLNIPEQPVSFDPRQVRSIKDLTIAQQLFDGLMRFDLEHKLSPALAESVMISEEGTKYTFNLRKAYWNNGELITAHDFVRSLQEVVRPDFPSDYASLLFVIKNAKSVKMGNSLLSDLGVTALDEKTLLIELEQQTPYFLELTAFPTFFPVYQDANVYSGPFILKSVKADYELILEKNGSYWDEDKVTLQQICFSIIADSATESLLFTQGNLDWLGQPFSNAIIPELLDQEQKIDAYSVAGTCWLTFNTDIFPLNELKVRQALTLAINRQQLITHILQGGQLLATSPLPSSMQLQDRPYFQDGDHIQAKELFASIDRSSLPTLTLLFPSTVRNRNLAQEIQNQLRKVLGIEILLEASEPHLCRKKIKEGAFQIAFGQWVADFNDPITFLDLFKLPRTFGLNDPNWHSEEYIALLNQAEEELNPSKRAMLLKAAERILMEEMPIAPLYHYAFDYAKKGYVSNVILSPLGRADLKYATINSR